MFFRPLLLPLLAQVALSFVVLARMYWLRLGEIQRKRIDPQSLANRREASRRLTDSSAASDNFVNLFETPVLFYAAILTALVLMIPDRSLVILAWMYVGLRALHSFIHTGDNTVMSRFYVFLASCAVLLGMWVRLGWYIVTA
jgi:hypothetical protein